MGIYWYVNCNVSFNTILVQRDEKNASSVTNVVFGLIVGLEKKG